MIRERLTAGKVAKKRLGRHVHGRVAFGYRSDRGVLEIDEETAPVVRHIFELARDGHGPARIARELNIDGVPPPRDANEWSRQAVRRMLTNPVYAGERHGVKRAHPPIVSRRTWNRAKESVSREA